MSSAEVPRAEQSGPAGRTAKVSGVRRRTTLAGQMLALQIGIICLVLVGVVAVSLAQSSGRMREAESRTALSAGEAVAAASSLRSSLNAYPEPADGDAQTSAPVGGAPALIRSAAERARNLSSSSDVVVATEDRVVVASADPALLETRLDLVDSPVLSGRSWVGDIAVDDGPNTIVAHVPVLSASADNLGDVIGLVAVVREYPTLLQTLATESPNLLTYLGLASALGVVGSLLLARRVKRQTLGLEPREIAGLVEHRDAMLHGIKEGVIALDLQGRVTMVNDEAVQLLRLPGDAVGRGLHDLGIHALLMDALDGRVAGTDQVVPVGDRVLILNRLPIHSRGRHIGSVTTLRDRTELLSLRAELDVTRHTTDTLRAQAHEFSNRLHTISGLIELGEHDEVVGFIRRLSAEHNALTEQVTSRIHDPAVAALLVAKGSLASEHGVDLQITQRSRTDKLPEDLSTDVSTVLGNLVDNALDAVGPGRGGWVSVEVRQDDVEVSVTVRDSGPGVAAGATDEVFLRGFSTKSAPQGSQRGIGLALIRLLCQQRGGDVSVRNEGGAVFTARLPLSAQVVP